jgi:hypothetical protein
LVVGGGWWLVVVGGWWWLVVGGGWWWLVVVGGGWWLVVGGGGDVNIMGRSVNIMKEISEALVVTGKEIGLEVNTVLIKLCQYSFLKIRKREKIATKKRDIKTFATVEQTKHVAANLTY